MNNGQRPPEKHRKKHDLFPNARESGNQALRASHRRRRFYTIFRARNREFFRDRAGLGWNILFPFLIIAGFGIIFGGKAGVQYKIGVFPAPPGKIEPGNIETGNQENGAFPFPAALENLRYAAIVEFLSRDAGLDALRHHRIDLLIQNSPPPHRYWVTTSSPKGYLAEKVLQASLVPETMAHLLIKEKINGARIRYIDWLFPGILGMNMMFSALWGVGWVVVRYRKNGVLKRFKATPLTAFEYLSAQMVSRIFVLMFSVIVVWAGCAPIFKLQVAGSYADLFVVFLMGSFSLTALGLLMASRGVSEEFVSGMLNFVSWPMMFLSGVWFSLEGAPGWVKLFSQAFPLTHLLRAVRKIMNDGAALLDVMPEIGMMIAFTLIFLSLGAKLFSWTK